MPGPVSRSRPLIAPSKDARKRRVSGTAETHVVLKASPKRGLDLAYDAFFTEPPQWVGDDC